MSPSSVNMKNDYLAFHNAYLEKYKPIKKRLYKYKLGDWVRLSLSKSLFTREFSEKWTNETFTISRRFRKHNINFYNVKSCDGESIIGAFYEKELNYVSPETEFKINKIIKRKGGKALVTWLYHPDSCQDWVSLKKYK